MYAYRYWCYFNCYCFNSFIIQPGTGSNLFMLVMKSFPQVTYPSRHPTDGCKHSAVSFFKKVDSAPFLQTSQKCDLGRFSHNIYGSFAKRFNRISLFCQVALEKQSLFFLAGEGSAVKQNFCLTNEMGSSCLGFKSLDALMFYETVEIGTVRAFGRACYRTIVQIVLRFFAIFERFYGLTTGLEVLFLGTCVYRNVLVTGIMCIWRRHRCKCRWDSVRLAG